MTTFASVVRRFEAVNATAVARHARKLVGSGMQAVSRTALGDSSVTLATLVFLNQNGSPSYPVFLYVPVCDLRKKAFFRTSPFTALSIGISIVIPSNHVTRLTINIGVACGLVLFPVSFPLVACDALARLDSHFI
jgi:hypothetical protein